MAPDALSHPHHGDIAASRAIRASGSTLENPSSFVAAVHAVHADGEHRAGTGVTPLSKRGGVQLAGRICVDNNTQLATSDDSPSRRELRTRAASNEPWMTRRATAHAVRV